MASTVKYWSFVIVENSLLLLLHPLNFFGGDKSETFANDSKASVLNSEDLLLPLISK